MSPWAPRRPCASPNCPALVPRGAARCPEHTLSHERAYRASRPAGLEKFYASTAWKRFRESVRMERITCQCTDLKCPHQRRGPQQCSSPGSHVDHIIEPWRDWSKALDPENVLLKCTSCHNSKTARLQHPDRRPSR